MILPGRFAVLNRLNNVRFELSLQVGKLGARHRPAISFSLPTRVSFHPLLSAPAIAQPMSTIIERECSFISFFR
jgi:hypothetical protein